MKGFNSQIIFKGGWVANALILLNRPINVLHVQCKFVFVVYCVLEVMGIFIPLRSRQLQDKMQLTLKAEECDTDR